jgi:hypothetical protein
LFHLVIACFPFIYFSITCVKGDEVESETGISNAVYRTGETVNDNGKVQLDSPIENKDLTEGSEYRSRKEKCFTLYVNNEFECFIRGSKHEKTV